MGIIVNGRVIPELYTGWYSVRLKVGKRSKLYVQSPMSRELYVKVDNVDEDASYVYYDHAIWKKDEGYGHD